MVDAHGPATLQQVADLAKVSLATASRAINGSTRKVNPELAERVHEAARRLNYSVNAPAQAMVRGRTKVVGLVLHDIVDPYFSSIAAGVIGAADEMGLLVSLTTTGRSVERELDHITMFQGQRAQALILAGSRQDDQQAWDELNTRVEAFEASGGRVVLIGQPVLNCDTIVVGNRGGARAVGEAMIGLGHEKFLVLGGPEHLLTAVDRTDGFTRAVSEAGLPEPLVVHGGFTRDGGHQTMLRILDDGLEATCIFAVADAVAIGALTALRERGVAVPDDVSLIGFDDIPTLGDVYPPLSTYRLPIEQMGRMAMEAAVTPRETQRREIKVTGEVILRASTRAI